MVRLACVCLGNTYVRYQLIKISIPSRCLRAAILKSILTFLKPVGSIKVNRKTVLVNLFQDYKFTTYLYFL